MHYWTSLELLKVIYFFFAHWDTNTCSFPWLYRTFKHLATWFSCLQLYCIGLLAHLKRNFLPGGKRRRPKHGQKASIIWPLFLHPLIVDCVDAFVSSKYIYRQVCAPNLYLKGPSNGNVVPTACFFSCSNLEFHWLRLQTYKLDIAFAYLPFFMVKSSLNCESRGHEIRTMKREADTNQKAKWKNMVFVVWNPQFNLIHICLIS